MHQLSQILKHLKDTGLIDAIIESKPLEQRRKKDIYQPPEHWDPWEGSISILFDTASWEVRVRRTPREWWLAWCLNHGASIKVSKELPVKECQACQIVHVIEDMK
jgi:hypothetical protein